MKLTDEKITNALDTGFSIARESWEDKSFVVTKRDNMLVTNRNENYILEVNDLVAEDWIVKETGVMGLACCEALGLLFAGSDSKYNRIFRQNWKTYLYIGPQGRLRWEDGMTYSLNEEDYNATDWIAILK